jgi:hypothetical protein
MTNILNFTTFAVHNKCQIHEMDPLLSALPDLG